MSPGHFALTAQRTSRFGSPGACGSFPAADRPGVPGDAPALPAGEPRQPGADHRALSWRSRSPRSPVRAGLVPADRRDVRWPATLPPPHPATHAPAPAHRPTSPPAITTGWPAPAPAAPTTACAWPRRAMPLKGERDDDDDQL